ncbi:MAG: PTPDL family protein [Verrucomicrobiaceae bacterium]
MQNKAVLSIFIVSALGLGVTLADKITLKSGQVIEGRVLEEQGENYLLEVQVTASIRDRKTVAKSEVASIEKEAPDKKPFEELADILPTGDQMPAGAYNHLIENRVKPFLSEFPKSKHAPKVKEMLSTLEEELGRVEAGDIKLEGQWIAKEDWDSNAIELDAQLELGNMKKAAARKQFRSAMQSYEKISRHFAGTESESKAKDLATRLLQAYLPIVSAKANSARDKVAKRKSIIANLPARDVPRVKAEFAAQEKRHQAALAEARELKTKWLPINDLDERTLKTLERNIQSELKNLERPPRSNTNPAELYREGWAAASEGDTAAVQRIISNLRSAKVDAKYQDLLLAQLEANPAPEPPKEEKVEDTIVKDDEAKSAAEKEKKQKKNRPLAEDNDDLPAGDEEESSMMPLIYAILGLAVIGILVGVVLKNRKSKE